MWQELYSELGNIIYRKHVVCQVTREKKDESAVEDTNSFLKESSFALLTLQSAIPVHADLMENWCKFGSDVNYRRWKTSWRFSSEARIHLTEFYSQQYS